MTDAQARASRDDSPGATETAKELNDVQMGAALSKLISASVGDIAVVMSRSPGHKHHTLADIELMVLPAVATGQFYVAEAASKERGFRAPIACVTWASVSDEVDARLREDAGRKIRLRPDEWNGGAHLWLVDMAGDAHALSGALETLLETRFKDKVVNVATRDADGAVRMQTLAELATAAHEAAA
jgi:hemolysin-activating ACP:hemolysin acyltransferase